MEVEFGRDVFASDGERLGTVAGLVVDAGTKELRRIVVGGGRFGGAGRLVDAGAVARSGPDGVHLDVASTEAEGLPRFVREEHAVARREELPPLLLPAAGVGGPVFYDNPAAGPGYPGGGGFFDPAPIDPPPLEVESNLPGSEVVLRTGAEVVGADGAKVGTVDEVVAGDRGGIAAFLVRAGFLVKHDVRVPVAWVAEVDDQRVRLTLPAAEAARRGRA